MVEVFSTNVENDEQAGILSSLFDNVFPAYEINFDLDDCDRILRVETGLERIDTDAIVILLSQSGFKVKVLSDTPNFSKEHTTFQNGV